MSVLISQSIINYVEEENIPALKALLEKCKDVNERNEVRLPVNSSLICRLLSAQGSVLRTEVGSRWFSASVDIFTVQALVGSLSESVF